MIGTQLFVKLYLITLPLFFALDMVWLSLVAKNFYAHHIGHLMAPVVNWVSALTFYLLFIAGLVVFVISPGLKTDSLFHTLLLGSFFGLITYATYDLTNLATLKNWPVFVTLVDLIWGTFLSATVSALAFLVAKKLNV